MIKKVFGKKICKCNKCNYVWLPIGDIPYYCSKCKSARWNDKRLINNQLSKPIVKTNNIDKSLKLAVKPKVMIDNKDNKEIKPVSFPQEDYTKAFNCAISKKMSCDIYSSIISDSPDGADRIIIPFPYCKACATGDFWSNAGIIKDFLSDNVNQAEAAHDFNNSKSEYDTLADMARQCTMRVKFNGISNCAYFNKFIGEGIKPPKKECYVCIELDDIWGHLAIKAKPKKNV